MSKPKAITQCVLFATLTLLASPWLYLLWVGAYLSPFSLFLRIRSLAEHAVTPDRALAMLNTRTTHANWMARLTVAPHRVNYHLEHHLFMQVPYYQLPRLHELLRRRGILQDKHIAKNYVHVIRLGSGWRD